MISGAHAMVEALKAEGVKTVFGYPGGAIAPFYDALKDSGIHHVLVRTEQNAGHAAAAYALTDNSVGVCVATSGPGALNLITGIATAYMDSVPLIAITGQVASSLLGRDSFQEADITGATMAFTKHRYLVKDAKTIPQIFKEAFYIANTGRKGPVLIDVPFDVQLEKLDFSYPESVTLRSYNPNVKGHAVQINKAATALMKAKRPVICAGGGVHLARAEAVLKALAYKCDIPVITTMMGISSFPSGDELCLGMLGMFGARASNRALSKADVILIAGARAADRAVSNPELLGKDKTVIHIDIDPAEIGKNLGVGIPIVGDLKGVLTELLPLVEECTHKEWREDLTKQKNMEEKKNFSPYIDPSSFIEKLTKTLPPKSIVSTDVGQNQLWCATGFSVKEGTFLTSGGMGTMGYSLPAAIGAKLACPQRTVIAVAGDGGFQMCMCELATMVQEDLDIKFIIMNNSSLGMIKEIQDNNYGGRHMAVNLIPAPCIKDIAKAYGIPFMKIEKEIEESDAISFLLNTEGPAILECIIPKDTATGRGTKEGSER